MFKNTCKLITVALILSGMGTLLSNKSGFFINFFNNIFLLALLLLMVTGSSIVIKGGMFNGIYYSFRRFYKNTSKLEQYVSQQTETVSHPVFINHLKLSGIRTLFITGVILFMIALAGSLV
jgi:hypothetical protein